MSWDFEVYPTWGAGAYGVWSKDENQNPCYNLNLEQVKDKDVWHLLGNDRITATAHAEGYVQIYAWDRGPQILNRYCPRKGHFAGGFSLIKLMDEFCITLRSVVDNIPTESFNITWGCGYVKKELSMGDITVEETIHVPVGKDPILIHTLRLNNPTSDPMEGFWIPYWEMNWYPLDPAWIMTRPFNHIWNIKRNRRAKRVRYEKDKTEGKGSEYLIFLELPTKVDRDGKNKRDFTTWYVKPVDCLFYISKGKYEITRENGLYEILDLFYHFVFDIYYSDDDSTPWEVVYPENFELLVKNTETILINILKSTSSQQYRSRFFTSEIPVKLGKYESREYRCIVGYDTVIEPPIDEYKRKYWRFTPNKKKIPMIMVNLPDQQIPLDRELRWHSYYLQAGCVYSELFKRFFVDQGSAYGYLHGASGAPRDWALFILPLIFLRPDLAREMILFLCQLQNLETGGFPYALVGNGKTTGAVVHSWSSDLDLFFMWAVCEYISATFDIDILKVEVPFAPPYQHERKPVLDHIKYAFLHLDKEVGVGKHGLIRCGTGDWNDALLAFSPCPILTALRGESVFNSALAVLILPQMAQIVAPHFPYLWLANSMNEFALNQKIALKKLKDHKWFPRGYVGWGDKLLGDKELFLDVQPFVFLLDIFSETEKEQVWKHIYKWCISKEKFGASCLHPPMRGLFLKPGCDTNGGIWHAINGLLIWALSRHSPEQAWDLLIRSTLFTHADKFPHVWYGIWSGPDAYNSSSAPNPGETYNLNFTPMSEFPIMNMNCHASILFATLKLFGFNPQPQRLSIEPKVPSKNFSIQTPLMSLDYTPKNITITYNPIVSTKGGFSLQLPRKVPKNKIKFFINNRVSNDYQLTKDNHIEWELPMRKGRTYTMTINLPTPKNI